MTTNMIPSIFRADFPLIPSGLVCGALGALIFLIPINWFWDSDIVVPTFDTWLILALVSTLWASLVPISHQRAYWLPIALAYALTTTTLAHLYWMRLGPYSELHPGIGIAIMVLLILPFAFLIRPFDTWMKGADLVESFASLIRQAVVAWLGLIIFWVLYGVIGGLMYLAGIQIFFDSMTVSLGFGISGLIGGACLVLANRSRPLIVGFGALFWIARWLAPILALALSLLAIQSLLQVLGLVTHI